MNIEQMKANDRNRHDLWIHISCPDCEMPMMIPRPYLSEERALRHYCPRCKKVLLTLVQTIAIEKAARKVYTNKELRDFVLNPSTEPEEFSGV